MGSTSHPQHLPPLHLGLRTLHRLQKVVVGYLRNASRTPLVSKKSEYSLEESLLVSSSTSFPNDFQIFCFPFNCGAKQPEKEATLGQMPRSSILRSFKTLRLSKTVNTVGFHRTHNSAVAMFSHCSSERSDIHGDQEICWSYSGHLPNEKNCGTVA